MDSTLASVEFTLQPAGMAPVRVNLRRAGTRWVARVTGGQVALAVGATARAALVAAVAPLGDRQVRALLADIGKLQPSIAVMEIEAPAQPA